MYFVIIMEIFSLYEGSYSVDSSKKFIPFDRDLHRKEDRPGSLFIHIHPFLVKTEKDLILLDTGLGAMDGDTPVLHRKIQQHGFSPDEVTLVLLSHLHKDHASGSTFINQDGEQTSFPNAEYVIQRQEWEEAFTPSNSDSYQATLFECLQRSGQIHFVEGSGQLNENISYELSGGHTQFHQVFLIKEGNQTVFFGGDEWPEKNQVLRKFAAKYDFDGKKAMHLREEYATRAANNDWLCLFYHDGRNAQAKFAIDGDSFSILRQEGN